MTDGVFVRAAAEAGCDTPPAFLPARPITQADLATLTERVRRRTIRLFRLAGLLDAAAAADNAARCVAGLDGWCGSFLEEVRRRYGDQLA